MKIINKAIQINKKFKLSIVTPIETAQELSQQLKEEIKKQGFEAVGIASVPGSSRIQLRNAALDRWLNAGHHADMNWMKAERRKNIKSLLKDVQSVISVGLNYYVDKKKDNNNLSIARYGWGKDYHRIIEKRLKIIGRWLENERPKCKWKICVDTNALLDKAWAEEAGIGWIGKNSNVINLKLGSWLVLGHLLCTEKLIPDKKAASICGECIQCISACPTQAIEEPFVVNSNKCLAYHTLENRANILPRNISNFMGQWVAGCDICQDVCPWNKKDLSSSKDPEMQPLDWILNINDKALLWSDEQWKKNLQQSTLKRIKPWMWRRNIRAIIQSKINKKSKKGESQ